MKSSPSPGAGVACPEKQESAPENACPIGLQNRTAGEEDPLCQQALSLLQLENIRMREAIREHMETFPDEPLEGERKLWAVISPPNDQNPTTRGVDSDSVVASCECFKLSPDPAHHAKGCKYRLISERDAALEEVARWKRNIIPFLVVHAGKYGFEHYGEKCMHYTHYDLLEAAGARMDEFIRCGAPPENKQD